jgi:Acyl-CoA reductase (LuxC)
MNTKDIIKHLAQLGQYISSPEFADAKAYAFLRNGWFEPIFIDLSIKGLVDEILNENILTSIAEKYNVQTPAMQKTVGVVAAGNIPMVAMHDIVCVLLSGHILNIKLSTKDEVLLKACFQYLYELDDAWRQRIIVTEMLKGCDAYIATGSNNSARYFEYYFAKYPSIIRKNRTSVAILRGNETKEQLVLLADDILQYFGMGCRNVTKLYVPKDYNFEDLLNSFGKHAQFALHAKLKNNYDYNLALYLLNAQYYMGNNLLLFVENKSKSAALSVVHYEYYTNVADVLTDVNQSDEVQCVVGASEIPFGMAQRPCFTDYADGIDTMAFLQKL